MVTKLADGVWYLDLGLVPPLATNAFLIDDTAGDLRDLAGDGGVATAGDDTGTDQGDSNDRDGDGESGVTLIDTGLFVNLRSLRSELDAAGYAPRDVDRVLLTHYDLDHTGGLSRMVGEFEGSVYLGEADARLVARENHPNLFHHKGLFHRVARRLAPLPQALSLERVTDGDRIGRFTAYHTPGHNPGHTVYVHDAGVAFLGDLVWEEEGELTPPFWLDSYDMRELRESIRRFADRTSPFEIACMGHGTPLTTGGYDALRRLADRL